MKLCYECNTLALELSKNARCLSCLTKRSTFNEKENARLRKELDNMRNACGERVQYLETLIAAVAIDLQLRAEPDRNEVPVVGLSNDLWTKVKKVVKQ